MSRRHSLFAVMLGGFLLTGVLFATPAFAAPPAPQVRVYVQIGPPAPLIDVRPAPPGPGFVWIAGYQRWNGRSHEWVPGRWERPPKKHAKWAPGQWKHDRRGWYWVDGRWR